MEYKIECGTNDSLGSNENAPRTAYENTKKLHASILNMGFTAATLGICDIPPNLQTKWAKRKLIYVQRQQYNNLILRRKDSLWLRLKAYLFLKLNR